MTAAILRVLKLPSAALDAAAEFHTVWLPQARATLTGDRTVLTIVLSPAPYDHGDWRRAVARDLARAATPRRVNLVAGHEESAIAAALAYLGGAPGVTGQYLPLGGAVGAAPGSPAC